MIKLATLFSGIGAIEQALKRLNIEHEIVFACDNGNVDIDIDFDYELKNIRKLSTPKEKNEYVKKLYKGNSRRTNFVEISYLHNYKIDESKFFYDIKLFDGNDFKGKVDLLVGGSPCQSFSVIGAKGGFEDTRGTLFYEFARSIKEIQPKVFIYENVFGMYKHDKGKTWATVQNVFDELGYYYKFEVLDSRDFGIPQGRRRVYVVGFKCKNQCDNFKFPTPIKLTLTMQDLLIDNAKEGSIKSVNSKLIINKKMGGEAPEEKYFLSQKLINYVTSPGTKKFMHHDAKIDLPIARALLATMGNTHRASVNNYVTTNGRIRALTARETHRLMGFPDDYEIVVSKAQAYKQSGNSIVVDVLIHLLKEILKVLEEENGKN
ncbi:MAG: DNA cytosine methyltransferase [Clostridia bacterium]|nr:DNA cytosine methyltransferase [Tissierellia bacterium]MDD4376310.1 DNA cytosine methyltransferase [Clostridia bacterium]